MYIQEYVREALTNVDPGERKGKANPVGHTDHRSTVPGPREPDRKRDRGEIRREKREDWGIEAYFVNDLGICDVLIVDSSDQLHVSVKWCSSASRINLQMLERVRVHFRLCSAWGLE